MLDCLAWLKIKLKCVFKMITHCYFSFSFCRRIYQMNFCRFEQKRGSSSLKCRCKINIPWNLPSIHKIKHPFIDVKVTNRGRVCCIGAVKLPINSLYSLFIEISSFCNVVSSVQICRYWKVLVLSVWIASLLIVIILTYIWQLNILQFLGSFAKILHHV